MDDEIRPEEVRSLLEGDDGDGSDEGDGDDEGVRVVDIRPRAAFRRGHIPGSENVPFQELADRVEDLADADHIVTVCPHGKASVQAARLIASYEGTADARVESMAGGLEEWPGDLVAGANGRTEAEDGDGATEAESPF